MLSVQKKLSECPVGMHESWAPWAPVFKQIKVSIACLTAHGELLLKRDDAGKFVLPSVDFSIGELLLCVPARAIVHNFGIEPQEMLDVRPGHKVQLLGWQCLDGECDVLMLVPVKRLRQLQMQYVKDFSELASLVQDPDAPVFVAAEALGWKMQEELQAA